jgi:hypothetical protein
MKFGSLNISYARRLDGLATSFKRHGSFAVLGLGGVLTIIWIVLIAWAPLQLLTSAISFAVSEMHSI